MKRNWVRALCVASLGALLVPAGAIAADRDRVTEVPMAVPPEEYAFYDQVIIDKFLTSQTTLVIIRRQTATRVVPVGEGPPGCRVPKANELFAGALDPGLLVDLAFTCQRPYRLESYFHFGVPYRFMSGDQLESPEVSLGPLPAQFRRFPEREAAPPTVGVLEFSRVAFNGPKNQALLYVGVDRPDGTGAGFLVWFHRTGPTWNVTDTEVLWIARPDSGGPS